MELFVCITDMQGKGLPLSFLFITTEEKVTPLTKQCTLIVWMTALHSHGIDPCFTLSDKDQYRDQCPQGGLAQCQAPAMPLACAKGAQVVTLPE